MATEWGVTFFDPKEARVDIRDEAVARLMARGGALLVRREVTDWQEVK